MMAARKSLRLVDLHCFLFMLMTTVLKSAADTATRSLCRQYQGLVPNDCNFRWSIPLSSKGKSVAVQVQAPRDLSLALIENLITPYDIKYSFNFGTWSNGRCSIGTWRAGQEYAVYYAGVLDASRPVWLWLSWSGGVIAAGTGSMVGQNRIMSYTEPIPSRLNYLLIGGCAGGTVVINHCLLKMSVVATFPAKSVVDRQLKAFSSDYKVDVTNLHHIGIGNIYDQRFPVNLPTNTTALPTTLDCGRQCEGDPKCKGYALARDSPLVGNITCNMFYSISGFQYDPQQVLYVYDD